MKKTIVRRAVSESLLQDNLPPLLQRIYSSRGVKSVAELERNLEKLDPYRLLSNIEQAVACLIEAIKSRQHIMIIGDYDADGATSTALAVRCLTSFGATKVSYLVPNRFEYGYGLTPEIVEVAAYQKPDLLMTVDNGISSHEGVKKAHEKGIKVLITDHHLPGVSLPNADAIVNPNLPDDVFPSKHLAGVGVVFYVMVALRAALREMSWFSQKGMSEPNMAAFLDLVALGTVADLVPLDKNNRILVYQGILRIRAGKTCPGIKALLQIANRKSDQLSAADLGFAVAPRLNAAGRLVDMRIGIECLLSENSQQALHYASQLDSLNKERQQLEASMRDQAIAGLAMIKLEQNLPVGLCLFDESWHQGIIGILASRVKDLLHRPVFAFAYHNEKELKGSGRSIHGLHLKDTLERIATQYPGVLIKFGGHAMAAGVSIAKDDFALFARVFDEAVAASVTNEDLQGIIHSDGELPSHAINSDTVSLLQNAGPWGQGFPEPVFDGIFKIINHRILKDKHMKFLLSSLDQSFKIDAVAFNLDQNKLMLSGNETLHVAYRLDINEYRGRQNVQFIIEYFETLEHVPL